MLTWGLLRSNLLFAIAVVLFVLEPLERQPGNIELSASTFMPKRNGEPSVDVSFHAHPLMKAGAGSGNRTRVFSLEGCCSTIELYPRTLNSIRQWWRKLDLNQRRLSQRIYSPSPLTTRAFLQISLSAESSV